MEIRFANRKLQKTCSSHKAGVKALGADCAAKLRTRLMDLQAAHCLEDLRGLGRIHELSGKRSGTLAIDLKHPFRLIVRPSVDPVPVRSDGGLDWSSVMAITVTEIVDYH